MPYYKPNGQPAFDSAFDSGGAGASLQQAAGNAAPDAAPSGTGTAGPSPVPEFEDIIGGVTDAPGSSTPDPVTVTATTTQTVTSSGSGLVFNNTFGSGATAAFINEVDAAETYLQSLFGNSCTVNCSFDVQSLNPNFSGENSFDPVSATYSQFVSALRSHASTPTAVAAANALSNLADPTGGRGVEVPIGEALILGLPINTRINPDDTVVLNSVYWTPSALQNNPGDAEAVIEHELTEGIMGRIGSLGIADVQWAPMDFFRYTASGQRDFTGGRDGQPTYFSADGTNVATGLQYHNSVNSSGHFDGFDFADWDGVGADSNFHDPFGPGGPGNGDPGTLSATDIQVMEALGWSPPVNVGTVVAVGDFNKDGLSDLAYFNNSTWTSTLQFLNGATTLGGGQITNSGLQGASGTGWTPVKSGDFNNDGYSDLVYYNASLGDTEIQLLNGTTGAGGGMLSNSSFENLPGWTVVGVGDFNKDGRTDLVYYNASMGDTQIQLLNGITGIGGGMLSNSSFENLPGWTVVGIGDFNGDGFSDIAYYNASLSETQIQLLQGTTGVGGGKLSNSSFENLPGWTVVGVGDFNGDAKADLVYYNASSGVTQIQFLNSTTGIGGGVIQNSPLENDPSWSVVGVGDFNHDGMSDLVYYNSSTGVYDLQTLNGIVATSTQQISSANGLASAAGQGAATNSGQPAADLFAAPAALDDGIPNAAAGYLGAPMELPFADGGTAPPQGWFSGGDLGAASAQTGWLTQQFGGAGMAAFSEPITDPGANAPAALAGALLHHG